MHDFNTTYCYQKNLANAVATLLRKSVSLYDSSDFLSNQVKGDEKISYICSHYYQAPGLIFGATEYIQHPSISGQTVSLLSSCARLSAHLAPLLPGGNAADHLIEIMKNAGSWQSN
ncbi:hypothetical protein ACFX12_025698 [Malus domestica]